ncbi:hypothetical protein RI129_007890 [Pyrocoelia pectoralis]|uniref:Regulatory protein zeste n=1 Tax=Pyrocoelia pectoralis TaxID=417401 RepID=A0AAN7ZF97_9COLE
MYRNCSQIYLLLKKRYLKKCKCFRATYRNHPVLKTGKISPNEDHTTIDAIWEKLCLKLNSSGDGPMRNVNAWKKLFTEWKSATRKKARENKKLLQHEIDFIEVTGVIAVDGMNIPELGSAAKSPNLEQDEQDLYDVVPPNDIVEYIHEDEVVAAQEESPPPKPCSSGIAPRCAKPKQKINKKKSQLLLAYEESRKSEIDGLQKIGEGLHAIANSINHLADVLEHKL